jgi:hypothetical protein
MLLPSKNTLAGITAIIAAGVGAPVAFAQSQTAHEEILGVDPQRGVVAYVERSPSSLPAFATVTLVEVGRDGTQNRIRLTTDEDVNQCRASHDAPSTRGPIDARVARDIESARSRYRGGTVLPVSQPLGATGCSRAPFARSEASLPDSLAIEVEPASDGSSTRLTMQRNGRSAPTVDVPSVTLTQGANVTRAPYNRIADVRELPGVDEFAVLLRSDACTPEGQAVPVRLVRIAAPPYPERPLQPMTHAELAEGEIIRALAPRARRRVVEEVSGWYEGRTRVVFDNAWSIPGPGDERILVQYTRVDPDMPPPVVDAGQANAQFALVTRSGSGRLRVLSQLAPPTRENVFEGSGQEAFPADLDGDAMPELVVRTRYRPDSELLTLLHVAGDSLQFVWRGQTMLDERTMQTATNPNWRHCDVGLDGSQLVSRCRTAVYRPNAGANADPISRGRLVQRVRWNGGVVSVNEERE